MAGLRIDKVSGVLSVNMFQHRWNHLNQLGIVGLDSQHVERAGDRIQALNVRYLASGDIVGVASGVSCYKSIQNLLELGSDLSRFQNWMKADPLCVLSDLDDVLHFNDCIVFEYLRVHAQETCNVCIESMTLAEQALEHFNTEKLADLEHISVLSYHVSED